MATDMKMKSRLYKLPAVKQCLYHPQLPTFRRMDIDTAAHKLPDQHCRTTAKLGSADFKKAPVTLYKPADKPLSGTNVTETGRNVVAEQEKPEQEKTFEKTMQLPYPGYRMRFYSPHVTGSWKYSLRQEPFVDRHGQRPLPANIFSRYRNLSSSYSVGTASWRV